MTSVPAVPTAVVLKTRQWSIEPDGKYDRPVDIWNPETGNWIPAFFKDIKAGDFYLLIGVDMEPGRCFRAGSDARRMAARPKYSGAPEDPSFVILGGMEIVQAPAMKDLAVPALETNPKRIT